MESVAISSSALLNSSVSEPQLISILLADELTLVREGLAVLCNSISGFRVVCQVGTAAAALAQIERLRPTIALLDLGLSDLAATEVVRRVRRQDLPTQCAILSARRDRKTVLEVLRAGASGCILTSCTRQQMEDALFQLAKGAIYMSPQIEVKNLLATRAQLGPDPIDTLSRREFQVFSLLVEGVRAKEIAARLALNAKTVDTYRSSLMRKLDIHDVAGLVKFAAKRDLVQLRAA